MRRTEQRRAGAHSHRSCTGDGTADAPTSEPPSQLPSQPPSQPVDVEALLAARRLYEARLHEDPSDGSARIGLAWSLLCEALCHLQLDAEAGAPEGPSAHDHRSPESLLRTSVHHAGAARRLALDATAMAEVERLETVVATLGRADLLREEDRAMSASTHDLLRSVLRRAGSDEG